MGNGRTPTEAKKFKIVIASQIEDFSFHYDEAKDYYLRMGDTRYIVPTAAVGVKITVYSEGTRVWEKGVQSPEEKKPVSYVAGFAHEEKMGEVVSLALNYSLRKIAEEMAQEPEIEKKLE
jgi:hypothetical protein